MTIVIDIDDKLYNRIKYLEPKANTMLDELMRSVQNGTPCETVTEFADRCRECGREKVLDEIRTEIEKLNPVDYGSMFSYESHNGAKYMKDDVLLIIDKYRKEDEA